ncbi:MAG: hypothetical protein R3F14_35095 [Polyangiaceae bacterium]
MSSVLLVSSAALVLAILIGAPRADLDTRATFDLLLGAAAAIAVLVSNHVWLFLAGWALSVVPLARDALRSRTGPLAGPPVSRAAVRPSDGDRAHCRRRGHADALPGAAARSTSLSLATSPSCESGSPCRRAGHDRRRDADRAVPLHLWIPAAIERARLPIAMQVVLAPVGLHLREGARRRSRTWRRVGSSLVAWATASACYGALLKLASDDVRRQLAYLRISGRRPRCSRRGHAPRARPRWGLFHDVTTTAALLGLLLVAGAVRARTGTSDMRRLGGIVQHAEGRRRPSPPRPAVELPSGSPAPPPSTSCRACTS